MLRSMFRGRWGAIPAAALFLVTATTLTQGTERSRAIQVHVSLGERHVFVIAGDSDTLFSAPAAVGSGRTLAGDQRTWRFVTPVGVTKVVAREVDPVWIPPDWHYVEVARSRGLRLVRLAPDDTIVLSRDRLLVVRRTTVGVVEGSDGFVELVTDQEIVFDGTLFMPPFGTKQRRVTGVLGPYRLVLANGVGLHGTPYKESIGKAVTHGCIRLHDADITWLYEHVPVGTSVVIHE